MYSEFSTGIYSIAGKKRPLAWFQWYLVTYLTLIIVLILTVYSCAGNQFVCAPVLCCLQRGLQCAYEGRKDNKQSEVSSVIIFW